MSEILKIMLTASATLIGGVLLLVLTKIFVKPIQKVLSIIGEIGYHVFLSRSLIQNIVVNEDTKIETIKELEEATNKFKELSAKLRSTINIIPFFSLFSYIRILPHKTDLLKAANSLSIISYCRYENNKGKISKEIDKLFSLLKIDMYNPKD